MEAPYPTVVSSGRSASSETLSGFWRPPPGMHADTAVCLSPTLHRKEGHVRENFAAQHDLGQVPVRPRETARAIAVTAAHELVLIIQPTWRIESSVLKVWAFPGGGGGLPVLGLSRRWRSKDESSWN